jgi:dGTPase
MKHKVLGTLEAQICNIADEIAYNNHDLDDGLRAKFLQEEDLIKHVTLWREADASVKKDYQNLTKKQRKTLINSHLISVLIESVLEQTLKTLKDSKIKTLEDVQKYGKPIVAYNAEVADKNKELRKYLFTHFYSHTEIYRMNKKGQRIIRSLFHAFLEDTKLLPAHFQAKSSPKERRVCD